MGYKIGRIQIKQVKVFRQNSPSSDISARQNRTTTSVFFVHVRTPRLIGQFIQSINQSASTTHQNKEVCSSKARGNTANEDTAVLRIITQKMIILKIILNNEDLSD